MPFPILDACLHLYAGEKMSPDEMARALASVCPGRRPGAAGGLRGPVRASLHPVDLQVGAVAAGAARRARSTSTASAPCRCRSSSARSGEPMTLPATRADGGAGDAWPVLPAGRGRARRRAPGAGAGRRPLSSRGQQPPPGPPPPTEVAAADLPVGRQAGADRRVGHRQRRRPIADLDAGRLRAHRGRRAADGSSRRRSSGWRASPRGNGEALEIRSQDHAIAEAGRDDVRDLRRLHGRLPPGPLPAGDAAAAQGAVTISSAR